MCRTSLRRPCSGIANRRGTGSGIVRAGDAGTPDGAAADATQGPIVPAGWKGPQMAYFHDTMTQCLVHDGVMPSCPRQFPKRVLTKISDAGNNPYVYELKGAQR